MCLRQNVKEIIVFFDLDLGLPLLSTRRILSVKRDTQLIALINVYGTVSMGSEAE